LKNHAKSGIIDTRAIQNDKGRPFCLLAPDSIVGFSPDAVVITAAEVEAVPVGVGVAVDVEKLVV
jgi:hypothetical protein